jgi:2-dehydropantoate 2-reductase
VKICFVGAGALGSAIGGTLARGGSEVFLVNRNKAHVEAINRDGLIMREDGVDHPVKVRAATDYSEVGVVDLVVVTVKSNFTQVAIEAARSIVGPETMVMSVQNGLGHEDILAKVVGNISWPARPTSAVSYWHPVMSSRASRESLPILANSMARSAHG